MSVRSSREERGKGQVDPDPSVHTQEPMKLKIPNIANYQPDKYSRRMAERSIDIIEAWLHKWEEAFAICEIRADMTKIRKATHMFAEAADRWWIKEQCDKVAATTWEEFKIEFNKHFLPPDEASRAWDQYRNLR